MMGGDLPSNDTWTTALLTNLEVLAIDQDSAGGHPVWTTDEIVVWAANTASDNLRYLALFNLGGRSRFRAVFVAGPGVRGSELQGA